MDHQRQAVFQEPLYPPESGEYLRESAYWDGIKQTSLQQFGVEGELDVMRITASYGGPFAFYHPPSLGLRHYDRTWPEVLDSHDSVEALPVGVVAGQECVVLACAQDSSPIRLVVWFDLEKSLLALRVLWCRPTDTSAGIPGNADVPKVIRIGDRQYEPFRRTEVLEFSQVGSGVWLPSKAIVQSGEIGDEFARSVIEMDLQNSIINEPVDEARFTIEPAGPTLVDDQVEDRSYEISGSPDGLTAMDRQFAENLRLIAEEDTGVSIVVESIHHPFYRSSCGPNAVLLSIALQGVPPDLEGILAEVPPNERECSFATLQSMTERRGLYCVAANLTWEQLTRFGDNAILQLISNEKQESHFVVGKACGDTIRIVPGPSPVRRVDREVFLESWSGNALLISKSPIDTVSLFASTRKMWPFVGGVALLALAGIAFVFAKKSKKPDSVEAPVA